MTDQKEPEVVLLKGIAMRYRNLVRLVVYCQQLREFEAHNSCLTHAQRNGVALFGDHLLAEMRNELSNISVLLRQAGMSVSNLAEMWIPPSLELDVEMEDFPY
jgi:hypothetical protein